MVKTYTKPTLTGSQARTVRRSDGLIEYWDRETKKLLCIYDPAGRTIQIQRNGKKSRIELPLDNPT